MLTLATEGRRPRPMARRCAIVLAWSVPAAVAGVAVLKALDAVTLQIAVSVGVAATLSCVAARPSSTAGRSRAGRRPRPGSAQARS